MAKLSRKSRKEKRLEARIVALEAKISALKESLCLLANTVEKVRLDVETATYLAENAKDLMTIQDIHES